MFRATRAVAASSSVKPGLVLGCGSNVMDLFFRVRSLPGPGEKQYFAGTQVLSASVVGGTHARMHSSIA